MWLSCELSCSCHVVVIWLSYGCCMGSFLGGISKGCARMLGGVCVASWAQVVVGVVLGRCPVALNMEQWLLDIGEESPDGRCHVFLVTPHDFGLPVGHAW